jgi:hypothetical protein
MTDIERRKYLADAIASTEERLANAIGYEHLLELDEETLKKAFDVYRDCAHKLEKLGVIIPVPEV